MSWRKDRFRAESVAALADHDVVITGGNSGIGFEAARVLAAQGARVVLACRDAARGEAARALILAESAHAAVTVSALDLASLASVHRFAERFAADHASLAVLINNAGVMALPRGRTAEGFEIHLGTNHLGHFALTARLFPLLRQASSARVITVSSLTHKPFRFPIDDPMSERRYHPWRAYAASKLANVYFMRELDRRLRLAGDTTMSLGCHPGYSATNLTTAGVRSHGGLFSRLLIRFGDRLIAQPAAQGALPILFAAASPEARGGTMIGPDGPGEMRGYPALGSIAEHGLDEAMAQRVWAFTEELTGAAFEGLPS
jgi:NAD(P)-dependent dehydrogenase (short-subunit alcohol dehydrogenase family)